MTAVSDITPTFALPDTVGQLHAPEPHVALVVVFTSNRCPFALAWHDRLIEVARDYAQRGVRMVMINANSAQVQPDDSLARMRERYDEEDWGPVVYLRDEDQSVARAFGAQTTPDVFVLDAGRRLRYRGAPDADCEDPDQQASWLRLALDAVLEDREVPLGHGFAVGCPIKWAPAP